jgi:serine/threonine protein kinase
MSQAIEAEEAFLRAKKKIARKLNAAFVLKDFPDKTFLPFGKAKDIILETTLDDFTELCKSADDVDAERDKDPKPTIDIIRTEEENSNQPCLVLAVLLCIDKFSPKDWRRFRNYLKERSRSHRLPLDKDDACKAFGPALGQSFYENQFPFCPIVLQKGIANIYTGTRSKCRLPYLEQTEHGSGSFGKVFKVKMPQGHLQGDGEIMTAPLARKEFKIRGRESFQKEWNTMQQILQRSRSNDNIIKTYASLETDLELSIFYPLAKCNLQEYLDNKAGVSSSVCDRLRLKAVAYSTRRELFKQIKGLAKALESLHSFDNNHGIATSCFHMDLKPENILIFPPKDGVELWKLTDFGISHVEQIGKKEHKMRSLDDLFVRRPGTPHQVSGPGGNGTFLAPEAMRPKAQVTNVYDVWSFACVVLLVMSFAHGGSSEARSFRDGLCKNDDGSEGSDWFFVTRDPKKFHSLLFRSKKTYKDQNEHGRPIVYMQNPRVAEQLARLSSSVQNACKDFYRALSSFLLKEALVPDPTERINASVFSKEFAKYFEKYLPASEERPSNFDGDQDYCEPRDLLHVSITYTMSSSEYVAFIAPSEIYIYETLNSRGSLAIELRPPSGKFWSCCALSDDLMCAAIDSSSSGSFEVCDHRP